MKRSEAREQAFRLLIEDKDIEEQLNLFLEENNIVDKNAIEYIKDVILGTNKFNSEIEKTISENIKPDWDISRISKIDLTLLKLGVYEIVYSKLPYKVVINEVVELAKKYGDDKSKAFVNGALAGVVKKGI